MQRPDIFSPAPRKNKMRLTIAHIMLSNSNLEKPYKLFFLGAGEKGTIVYYYYVVVLYYYYVHYYYYYYHYS